MKRSASFLPALAGVLLLTGGYLILYQFWYGATPMGMDPVLDGKQNLLTAERFLNGGEFEEPFHRAPLYPFLLALLQKLNFLALPVPSLVRLLNSAAVLASTWLAAHLAWRIWKRVASVWITGLLVGLNPVILFFAGDPLDITLATTCYMGAAWILYNGYKSRRHSWASWLGGGLIVGLGMAMRSHMILLGLTWPLLAGLGALQNRYTRKIPNLIAAILLGAIGPITSFVGVGIANYSVSGDFRMTPWGGAYLLWAGNGPMNNGRYYAQTVRVEFDGKYENPTKFESIYHYQQMTGEEPPFDVEKMNAFFINQTFEEIYKEPGAWIGLMLHKVYSLVHNYEQYDNKTFSLHKSVSALLAFNPICWGLILTLATMGGAMLYYSRKTSFWGLIIVGSLYAVMILATFTANRYRVPLIPLLAVLAGGVARIYYRRDQLSRRGVTTMSLLATLTIVITFVPFAGIADKDTYLADYALMANAAHRQGADLDAVHWAEMALAIDSSRDDLREVAALSKFNYWFTQPENTPGKAGARKMLEELEQLNRSSAALSFAQGVYLWKLGDQANACSLWRFAAQEFGHVGSIEALVWNCDPDRDFLEAFSPVKWERILAVKNGQAKVQVASGKPNLTEDEILAISDTYRIAYEPFMADPSPL